MDFMKSAGIDGIKQPVQGMWLARHRDANAWYHIYPIAQSEYVSLLHVVRHKKASQEMPKIRYHLYKSTCLVLDLLKIFIAGFKVLLKHEIRFIVTFNPVPWGSVAWILARLFRKPIILGFIGADFNYYLKNTKWKYFLVYASRHSSIITVTGYNMKEYFLRLGIKTESIFTYPHCVKDEFFVDSPNENRKYDVITVCNLIPRKRVQDIILAIHRLKQEGKLVNLCIVGDGLDRFMLENLAREKEVSDFVHFLGWQSDVLPFLKQSKIYVQASSAEGFSISLIEGVAAGLIPITTKVGSEGDHIKDGYNGFFFEVGDYAGLAKLIEFSLLEENYSRIQQNVLKEREYFRTKNAIQICNQIIERIIQVK